MQEILTTCIRTDASVQSREKINMEYVAELVDAIKGGKKLPPVDVYKDGDDVWLADGWHRLLAHQEANKRTIRAEVHRGGRKEARWHSVGSNQQHGLRRTNEDKIRCVKMALEDRPELTSRAIAEHVGVSHTVVDNSRRQVATVATSNVENPNKRLGLDGKSYPAAKPRPPWEVVQKTPPPPPQADPVARPVPPPSDPVQAPKPPPPPKPANEERFDAVGQSIPDHLWAAWDRGEEMAEMAATVTRLANVVKRYHDEDDKILLDGNGQAIVAALRTAKQAIEAEIPYAVCPYCNGLTADSCRFCRGRGIVGEYQWKMVPVELRK